jgi:DNA-binding response OmpR family regulator
MVTIPPTKDAHCAPEHSANTPKTVISTKILLVEDEPLTAEVFARALTRAGHLVTIARDGLQATKQLRERPPSLVVLDMSLPTVSGISVIRSLRESSASKTPVIVVSGSDQRQSSLTQAELEPGLWLTKPIKPNQLVAIVNDIIQRGLK